MTEIKKPGNVDLWIRLAIAITLAIAGAILMTHGVWHSWHGKVEGMHMSVAAIISIVLAKAIAPKAKAHAFQEYE